MASRLIRRRKQHDQKTKYHLCNHGAGAGAGKCDCNFHGDQMTKKKVSKVSVDEFDVAAVPDVSTLATLKDVALKALELHNTIESAEEYLSNLKADLHDVLNKQLPDLMASAGTTKFVLQNGSSVEVISYVSGSLPKDDDLRRRAFQWIAKAGAEDIIKNFLSMTFGKGQDNVAGNVRAQLDEMGVEYQTKKDVHPMTLAAFARERLKNGEPVPLDILGLTAGRAAKLKPAVKKEVSK